MENYYFITLNDVGKLLPFISKNGENLKENLKNQDAINLKIVKFLNEIEKHSKEKFVELPIADLDNIMTKRFLISNEGYMEMILKEPLVINVYFKSLKKANTFLCSLKYALKKTIDDSNSLKDIFIEELNVEKSENSNVLTIEKWERMHNILIRNYLVYTFIALVIVVVFEAIKGAVGSFLFSHSLFTNMISAVIIAFMFEPVKKRTERFVEKYLIKNK